VKADQISVGFH